MPRHRRTADRNDSPRPPATGILATVIAIVAGGILLAVAVEAVATPLAPYRATREVRLNLLPPASEGDFGTLRLADPRFGAVAGAAGSGNPSPSLSAFADITGPDDGRQLFGRGSSLLDYQFEIVGPQALVPVRITVHGAATGTASGDGSIAVEAFWSLYLDRDHPLAGDDVRSGQVRSFEGGFDRVIDLVLAANQPYTISMLADAAAGASIPGAHAIAQAFVDPLFELGFGVDAALYRLAFSPGIGNAAAVPEPGSMALLALALILLARQRHVRVRRSGSAAPRGTRGAPLARR